jgi:hypothetical protein
MQKFPIINKEQVAVLYAEKSTGNVLDINFKIAVTDTQIVFQIFESLNDAITHINHVKVNNDKIEFVIHDSEEKFLQFIH